MFNAPNGSVPEGDLIGHLKRNQVGEMKEVEKLAKFVGSLGVRMRLVIGLAVEHNEIIGDIAQRTEANNAKHRIGEDALIHHEVDDFKFFVGICEERDRVSMLIVRQEQPPRCPDELRYAQPVAGLDAPRLHEGLLREQALHTSVG